MAIPRPFSCERRLRFSIEAGIATLPERKMREMLAPDNQDRSIPRAGSNPFDIEGENPRKLHLEDKFGGRFPWWSLVPID
jgi:hypothetical protein